MPQERRRLLPLLVFDVI